MDVPPTSTSGAAGQSAQTVDAAMRVLDVLEQDGDGLSVAQLSRAIGRSRGATYRVIGPLQDAGLIARQHGKYILGPRILQLARHVQRQSRLVTVAAPHLTALCNRFLETVFISIISGPHILTVDEAVAIHPLRFSRGVGAADPIHTGATGRALLATLDEDEREKLFAHLDLRSYTALTITDLDRLRREVKTVVEQGFAISFGEYIPGVTSLACPIVSADGGTGAAITMLGPQHRFTESAANEALPALREAAVKIASKL